MATTLTLAQEAKIVGVLAPAADAAGRTSRYVNTALAERMNFRVHINQGNAATVQLSLVQASAAAGTGSKALSTGIRIWVNENVGYTGGATDTLVAQGYEATYTTGAGTTEKDIIIEVDPTEMDLANGFTYVAVVTGASNAANITEATAIAMPIRYAGDQSPTMVT